MGIRATWILVCGSLLCVCAGCEEPGTPKVPVTGTVTFNGKPLDGAIVSFTPKTEGLPASATTDAEGKYVLTTETNGDGAVIGEYAVTIAKYDRKAPVIPEVTEEQESDETIDITEEYPPGYDEMDASEKAAAVAKNLLPRKYSDPNATPLVAQVKESSDDLVIDFELAK